jgi:pyridoxal phosphate enzyme (YggS family)
MDTLFHNLNVIKTRIADVARSDGHNPADIQLVAVSKTRSEADIRAALAAGQMLFGENRVQEAKEKFTPLRVEYPSLALHLIGPLQTNKVEDAVRLFDVIETLDRPRLAEALAKAIQKTGKTPRLYIEVNIGNEPQKSGIAPAELGDFLAFGRDTCGLPITGLMGLPPQGKDPEPYFRQFKRLKDQFNMPHLSMGMSADFESAIRCGATEVRVGTALFGARMGHISHK